MGVSEAHKNGNRKWDKDNMRSVSCRLRTQDAKHFKEWCKINKTTPGAMLKNYVYKCLEEYNDYCEKHYGGQDK